MFESAEDVWVMFSLGYVVNAGNLWPEGGIPYSCYSPFSGTNIEHHIIQKNEQKNLKKWKDGAVRTPSLLQHRLCVGAA